jgi:hypothetical protein
MPKFDEYGPIEFDGTPGPPASIITGPSVACVGWIPYYAHPEELPECDYQGEQFAKSVAFPSVFRGVLFRSGNRSVVGADDNPSPEKFDGAEQFLKFIASKNFRAALALHDVKLGVSKTREPCCLEFKELSLVGYTPFRVAMGDQVLEIYRGIGRRGSDPDLQDAIQVDSRGVTIHRSIRAKICRLAEFGGLAVSGKLAPSAIIDIQYRIECSGRITVGFLGTCIPSQTYYVDWIRKGEHDMMKNTSSQIDGFLAAGSCQDAPVASFFKEPLS